MGIIAQQDGNYSLKNNDIVFCEGEKANYLNILLQGKMDVYINPFRNPSIKGDENVLNNSLRIFTIDQNSFIGANDLFGEGSFSLSYRAAADCSLYVFVADSQEKLNDLYNARKEYPAYIVASIINLIDHSYSALARLENLIQEFGVSVDNLSVYFWMQKEELGFKSMPASTFFRDNLDNVQKLMDKGYSLYPELNPSCFDADYSAVYEKDYKVTNGINMDKLEYLRHLAALPQELQKTFFSADNFITSYICREASEFIIEMQDSIREAINMLFNITDKLYSQNNECLFNLFINAAEETAKEGGNVNTLITALDYIAQKVVELVCIIETDYRYKMGFNIDSISELLNMQKLKIQTAGQQSSSQGSVKVAANAKAEAIPEALRDGVDRILEYSGIANDKAEMFKINLGTYRRMKDKFDLDPDARKIRNSVASVFFEVYEEVFKRVYNEKNDDLLYRMFLNYGYMDEKLLDIEHIITLYEIANTTKASEQNNVHDMYSWLSKIYSKEKDPSINEFNMDYFDVFRDMRKRGEIGDEDKPKYDNDLDGRLSFEIRNMLKTNQRLCHGQLSVYFPILHNEVITKDLKKALVTPQVIQDSINKLLEIDFSAFHREISYYNAKKGIEKEFVMMPVQPDLLLLPIYGTRAIMWQELSGRVRSTPGRFLLPVFTGENMDDMIVKLAGHFRWELCKTMMGVAWNDITQSSLTADYTDYIQFFKKNKDLSEDAKEKLKTQIQKNRGMLRDIFTSDYETWINYEAKGNLRLNKVVRKILYKHCPFAKPIRENLEKHPMYGDIAPQFKTIRTKHARDLELRYTKYAKPGEALEPELEENLKFYKEK